MKLLLVCLAAGLMQILALPATATELIDYSPGFTGAWWQSLTAGNKLVAVQGMLVGYESAIVRQEVLKGVSRQQALNDASVQKRNPRIIVSRIDEYYRNHSITTYVSDVFACMAPKDQCTTLK